MRPANIDEDRWIDLYVNQKLTAKMCASMLGVSQSTLVRRLKKLGVSIRSPTKRLIEDVSDEQVVDLYWNKNFSIARTAEELGKSCGFVKGRLKKSGHGTRTVRDGVRLSKGSDEIKNEQLIYMHDTLGWSCVKISKHFGKTEEFVRQRFISIGKDRRKNIGQHNGSWKGGITNIRNAVRSCAAMLKWRDDAFARSDYKSELSGETGVLNCHHIYPFRNILKSSIRKHSFLPAEYRDVAIVHDARFCDNNNSLVVTKSEHDEIERCHNNANQWWKIWRLNADVAIDRSGMSNEDFNLFDSSGMITVNEYRVVEAQKSEIEDIIRYEHYIGTIPVSKIILTAKVGGIIVGIATFGSGTNKHTKMGEIELTRLCVPSYVHRHFSCCFLKQCRLYIRQHYRCIKKIVAFADHSVGHDGGVYRMAGWKKCGKTQPSYVYFDPTTLSVRHKAACRRIKGVDKTEKELAKERGWIRITTQYKYKYSIST